MSHVLERMATLCNCNTLCKKKYPNVDASVLGSDKGDLRKTWRKLKEFLERNYRNLVNNLGIKKKNSS